jgi:beta-phosphoglucomutase-like phosphatase (HAD superfamily)
MEDNFLSIKKIIPDLKAIFFDFDGVLVDSVSIKELAYQEIFEPYGREAVESITLYHRENGGIDRHKKIEYVIQKHELNPELGPKLALQFSELVFQKVIDAPKITSIFAILNSSRLENLKTFVISGTPEEELKLILAKRNWSNLFDGIFGSPKGKIEIVEMILKQENLHSRECIFFGDAMTDYKTAIHHKLWYFGVPSD